MAFIRDKGPDSVDAVLLPSNVYRSDLMPVPVPENSVRVGFGLLHAPEGLTVMRNRLHRNSL